MRTASQLATAGLVFFSCLIACANEKPSVAPTKTPSGPSARSALSLDLGENVTMEFVLIPAGTFTMGSDSSKLTDEKPVHEAVISKPFYLGKFEVTQEQWAAVMAETPAMHKGPQYPESHQQPVENVSWNYSQVFLRKLSEKISGYTFRLPTEAEWEYACRAGSREDYSCGNNVEALSDCAWFSANANGQTHPVGLKKPNAWGLYDMHGNVWEWCEDVYAPYSTMPAELPQPSDAVPRVLRGGAFNSLPKNLRAACRHNLLPDDSYRYYGLRCVAVPKEAPGK